MWQQGTDQGEKDVDCETEDCILDKVTSDWGWSQGEGSSWWSLSRGLWRDSWQRDGAHHDRPGAVTQGQCSHLMSGPGMMNTILIISVRVSTHRLSEVSKQFASNSLCLASVVAVEDWWLLLLIEYNIKCRQSMCVCIPVVSRLQCYTRHTKTRLTLITRVQASLNAKWTYPLFIQPAIVRGIVFVCLSNSHSTPFDLVYHVTCVLIFPVSSKIKSVRGLGVMGRRVLGGRGWGSHSGDIYCYGTICTKARQSIRMKHIRLIGIATPSPAAQYWK